MTLMLMVTLAGAVGAVLRAFIEMHLPNRSGGLPWGLLAVNVGGCALAGVIAPCTSGDLRTVLLVGLCGALTTYSGFALRVHLQLQAGRRWLGASTVLLMVVACLAACVLMWWLAPLITLGSCAVG
jgi:CrcB protein